MTSASAQPSGSPPIPGYKTICTVVGALYVLLGASMVARGAVAVMSQFQVPDVVLGSPQFQDFFHWVFVHMMVLGLMIAMLGRFVEDGRAQRVVAGMLVLVELHYTYLDVRTSDSALGSGLYKGSGSLVPPIIDVLVTLAFAYLAVRGPRKATASASG